MKLSYALLLISAVVPTSTARSLRTQGSTKPFPETQEISDSSDYPDADYAMYVIKVGDQEFNLEINDPDTRKLADRYFESQEHINVYGPLIAGDGGFNTDYSWHIDPDQVGFSDVNRELCDAEPSFVEEELEYWLDTVGEYCPWNIQVVAKMVS